jgi:hypothetical protein
MDSSSLLVSPARDTDTGVDSSSLLSAAVDIVDSGAPDAPGTADGAIKRPDGTTWSTHPTNTWLLYKLFVTIVCVLSMLEGLSCVASLWIFALPGVKAWVAFGFGLAFVLISSCITGVSGVVLHDPQMQQPGGCHCLPFLLAFCKMGSFNVAWRTLWYPERRNIPLDDDLSEHLVPVSLFMLLLVCIESTPMLLIRTYVLGLMLNEMHGVDDPKAQAASWLLCTVLIAVAFQSCLAVLYEKAGTDYRNVFIRTGRSTVPEGQLFQLQQCVLLFLLRFFEGCSWLATLAAVAFAFRGWYFLVWVIDFFVCGVVFSCTFADRSEEDWEVSATFRVLFSLFFSNPLHDGDSIMVFRARAPSFASPEPSFFAAGIHYGWRAAVQLLAVVIVRAVAGGGGGNGDQPEETTASLLRWLCAAIVGGTACTWAVLYAATLRLPSPHEVERSLLLRRRPDGIPDELHDAVATGDADCYAALGREESMEVRAWVFREHWYRNRPKGTGKLELMLSREEFVESVLGGVSAATPEQLQRGSRVIFEDGERGIDAGGLTREMYSQVSCVLARL